MIRSQAHRWLQWVICRSCDEERPSNGHKGFDQRVATLIAGGVLAFAAALAASPGLAAQDYPPGLFENSPVVPSGSIDGQSGARPLRSPSSRCDAFAASRGRCIRGSGCPGLGDNALAWREAAHADGRSLLGMGRSTGQG